MNCVQYDEITTQIINMYMKNINEKQKQQSEIR